MHDEQPMSRAHSPLAAARSTAFAGGLSIEPYEGELSYNFRIDPADLARASMAFGVALPGRMGDVRNEGERRAICLGPDEWLLLAPAGEAQAIEAAFAVLADTYAHSLVNVSDRECGVQVRGPLAAFALMAGCPLDLETMPVGTATRTLFDHADVLVVKESEEHFRVTFLRSWSGHTWSLLTVVGREIAAGL